MRLEKFKELEKLYHSRRESCCKCGCTLEDNTGNGLGSVFVLDTDGNYYCMNCDSQFEDGDERIFEPDLFSEELEDAEEVTVYTRPYCNQTGTIPVPNEIVKQGKKAVSHYVAANFNSISFDDPELDYCGTDYEIEDSENGCYEGSE